MATKTLPLNFSLDEQRLVDSYRSQVRVSLPVLSRGDEPTAVVSLLRKPPVTGRPYYHEALGLGETIEVGIGAVGARPSATTPITFFAIADPIQQTDPLTVTTAAADIATALNALPAVAAAGGLTVELTSAFNYRLLWTDPVGVKPEITVGSPTCQAILLTEKDESGNAIGFNLELVADPMALATEFTRSAGSTLTASQDAWSTTYLWDRRAAIGGTTRIRLGLAGDAIGIVLGEVTTRSVAYNISASNLQEILQADYPTFRGLYEDGGPQTALPITWEVAETAVGLRINWRRTDGKSLVHTNGFGPTYGTLVLWQDTVGLFTDSLEQTITYECPLPFSTGALTRYMSGKSSVQLTLEVKVIGANGDPLSCRVPVTIEGDLIRGQPTTPDPVRSFIGHDGVASLLYFALADAADGSGFAYIGDGAVPDIDPLGTAKGYWGYVKRTEPPAGPLTAGDFAGRWIPIRGGRGLPGTNGDDATTFYPTVAYADSAAGAGFTTDPVLGSSKGFFGFAFKPYGVGVVAADYTGRWQSKASSGLNGWTAITANVVYGEKIVEQIVGYWGGSGDEPEFVGQYLSPTGPTTVIGDASDKRGAIGNTGAAGTQLRHVASADDIDNGVGANGDYLIVPTVVPGTGETYHTYYVRAAGVNIPLTSVHGAKGDKGDKGDPADPQVQADWTQADAGAVDFIKNKPSTMDAVAHAASHGVAGADPITIAQSQVTDLGTALGAKANSADLGTAATHAATDFDVAGAAAAAQAAAEATASADATAKASAAQAAAIAASQPLNTQLTGIAGLGAPAASQSLWGVAGAWALKTLAEVKTLLGLGSAAYLDAPGVGNNASTTQLVRGDDTRINIANGSVVEYLAADRTLYVGPAGSDANSGLTSGAPLATVQAALNKLSKIHLNGYAFRVRLLAGTYTGQAIVSVPPVGYGPVTAGQIVTGGVHIQSDSGVNTDVVLQGGGTYVPVIQIAHDNYRVLDVSLRQTDTTADLIQCSNCYEFRFSGLRFGQSSVWLRLTFAAAYSSGNCSAYENGTYGFYASFGSILFWNSQIALGTRTLTLFMYCASQSNVWAGGATYTGTLTGKKYVSSGNGIINSGGVTFPGSTAGTTDTGGQYL